MKRMNMKLELASFPVKDIRFGKQTSYKKGVLEVNKEELMALVLEDERIASADLEIAFPNEQTRIVHVRDAVEPRVKVSGSGCVFPGILGPAETVGEGRTHKLSGAAVIVSAQYRPTILGGYGAQSSAILDMWGPGALLSPLGSTINIILILRLLDSVTEPDAHTTIKLAEFKVANRLAEATRHVTPESTEVFGLPEVDPSLPRVVYILGVILHGSSYPCSHVYFYGMPVEAPIPNLVHPNEFLDGAVTVDPRHGTSDLTITWGWMNQPVILELLREHGKRLNFLGVILQRTRFISELGKKVAGEASSQIAARLLGADGTINSGMVPSGANFMDAMFTVQACEKKGLKTVLITPEWGVDENETVALPYYVPEATAMVSAGVHAREIKLPAPTKVIGVEKGQPVLCVMSEPPFSPWGEITLVNSFDLFDGSDWWGRLNFTCKEY